MAYILNACSLVLGQKSSIDRIDFRTGRVAFILPYVDSYRLILEKKNVAALGKHFQLISILFRVCHWFLKNYESEDGL